MSGKIFVEAIHKFFLDFFIGFQTFIIPVVAVVLNPGNDGRKLSLFIGVLLQETEHFVVFVTNAIDLSGGIDGRILIILSVIK